MSVNREKIQEIVEVFYQPTFKTFYVNSTDSETFIKPIGVFVSLGITTSLKVIKNIGEVIAGYNYNTRIVEISSRKVNGQFLNTITYENPSQYLIEDSDSILGKEKATEELCKLKEFMNPSEDIQTVQDYAPKIQKLQELIDELDNDPQGWENHVIKKDEEDDDYKVFHRQVNYRKTDDDVEYRIGIFVSEKEY